MTQRLFSSTTDIPSIPAPNACPFFKSRAGAKRACSVSNKPEAGCHYLSPAECSLYAEGIMELIKQMRIAAARTITLEILEAKRTNGHAEPKDPPENSGTHFKIPTTLVTPLPELPPLPKPTRCPFVRKPDSHPQCGTRFRRAPVCHPWEPQNCTGYSQRIREWQQKIHVETLKAIAQTAAEFEPPQPFTDQDTETVKRIMDITEQLGV